MRHIILLFAFLLFAGVVSAQSDTGYPKPSYIRWLPETGTYYFLVGDTTTHTGAWFELGAGFSVTGGVISVASAVQDSVFVLGDSLCAISLGDTVCVANDSVYITQDSFCYIEGGDTTCVNFEGGIQGINIYNTSDTITAGEDRIVVIPSTSTLAFKESGSTDFIKMYPVGDSTVFSKDAQFNAGILDGDGDIGGAGQVMTTTGSQTNWVNPAALNVPISGLFAALGTNSINNSNYEQEWTWPSFTGANDGLKLTAAGTAHTTSTGNLLLAEMSGANAASSVTSATASIRNIHSGTGANNYALQAEALNGASNYAVYGTVAGGYGIYGNATTGTALYGIATTGTPLAARLNHTTTNDIKPVANLERISSGTAGNGIGASLTFASEVSTGSSEISNTIASEWTEVTYATRGSKLSLSGVSSGSTQNVLEILGSGATRLNKYGIGTFTGTPAYTLQVDASGNIIEGVTTNDGNGMFSASNNGADIPSDFTADITDSLQLRGQLGGTDLCVVNFHSPNVNGSSIVYLTNNQTGSSRTTDGLALYLDTDEDAYLRLREDEGFGIGNNNLDKLYFYGSQAGLVYEPSIKVQPTFVADKGIHNNANVEIAGQDTLTKIQANVNWASGTSADTIFLPEIMTNSPTGGVSIESATVTQTGVGQEYTISNYSGVSLVVSVMNVSGTDDQISGGSAITILDGKSAIVRAVRYTGVGYWHSFPSN